MAATNAASCCCHAAAAHTRVVNQTDRVTSSLALITGGLRGFLHSRVLALRQLYDGPVGFTPGAPIYTHIIAYLLHALGITA